MQMDLEDRTFTTPPMLGVAPKVCAGIEYGRRSISWTQLEGGKIGGCAYAMLWVTVAEPKMLAGEATELHVQRRVREDWKREPLTDKARAAVREVMLPAVNRYGFDRLWNESRDPARLDGYAVAEKERALRWAAFAQGKIELGQMEQAGLVSYRPVPPDPHGRNNSAVLGFESSGRECQLPVLAEAWVDGVHVGWLDDHAYLIPKAPGTDRRPLA